MAIEAAKLKAKRRKEKKILVVLVNTQRDSDRWWVQMRVLQTQDNLPGRRDSISGPWCRWMDGSSSSLMRWEAWWHWWYLTRMDGWWWPLTLRMWRKRQKKFCLCGWVVRCNHRTVSLCFAPTAPRTSDNLLTLVPIPLKKTEIESTQTSWFTNYLATTNTICTYH